MMADDASSVPVTGGCVCLYMHTAWSEHKDILGKGELCETNGSMWVIDFLGEGNWEREEMQHDGAESLTTALCLLVYSTWAFWGDGEAHVQPASEGQERALTLLRSQHRQERAGPWYCWIVPPQLFLFSPPVSSSFSRVGFSVYWKQSW